MNPYSNNNFVTIITAEGKYIPYLKSTLSGVSDEILTMISPMNELHLNFLENEICAFITWLEKNTINENPYLTHYTKSIEESAKDKAVMVKIAQFIKMKDPEMMFDFIYESFCECDKTDEYDNKSITSNDFGMYGAIKKLSIYDYDSCINMLLDINTVKLLADDRLKTPNYEDIYRKTVMKLYEEEIIAKFNIKTDNDDSNDNLQENPISNIVNLSKKQNIEISKTEIISKKQTSEINKLGYIIVKPTKKQVIRDIFDQ